MHRSKLWQVRVRGLVQGVGFRPLVWQLATRAGLQGEVLNDAEGVLIRLASTRAALNDFLLEVQTNAPPLSRIDDIEVTEFPGELRTDGFTINPSQSGDTRTAIVPDAATCSDCIKDIRDPQNRRFRYAFTNCTNCGPRLSITSAIPYDRANTSMAAFVMCTECQREYDDPADRRFHAQANACPKCGPRLTLVDRTGRPVPGDPIAKAADALTRGEIVAIKGLGGFQLACDATSQTPVEALRYRKKRPTKPLALMGRDLAQVAQYVHLSPAAKAKLTSPSAPIILAPIRRDAPKLAPGTAPGQNRLGFMLPNTPLHHLLLEWVSGPLVMTSGNLSGEPQITENDDAIARLAVIADLFLVHNRDIVNRVDDSVVQIVDETPHVLRRARGFSPEPLNLHSGFADAKQVLATGADPKNTFCVLKGGQAIVSQHIGDMANDRAHRDFRANLSLFSATHDFKPAVVGVDGHPDYFSSRIGREVAAKQDVDLIEVQHHHAHIAAVLAEHGLGPEAPRVLGIVLDGIGRGADETLWGGEFLHADYRSFCRVAHFAPIAMAGGDKASQQPWRNTYAHLRAVFGPDPLPTVKSRFGDLSLVEKLSQKPLAPLEQMIARGLNAPLASSAGRLFDAVAGALGICFDQIDFEGQAAMLLQFLAEKCATETGEYRVETGPVIAWNGLWIGVLTDLGSGVQGAVIAARFHNTLVSVIARQATELSKTLGNSSVVLSGGVFQNALLLSRVKSRLEAAGLKVLVPRHYPANDSGIALGQATIVAAQSLGPTKGP